ncbi:hypothetical protein Ae201684P_016887 [Aphanomyces euteiches]|uniref:very-long-chain (3R)-3-hydroxyacyl-CoA dehydratase n=1 Tax=Aphanomyces euteiches TaxID=100861 RepID=A0A6G0XI11_9STRA|nr:hypothetical protein Ae201684_004511 [Aphanomyces euteiches]KAH9094277.1 hypothetical protein Ae201684P_016887 [Aphanomyces euteiches]
MHSIVRLDLLSQTDMATTTYLSVFNAASLAGWTYIMAETSLALYKDQDIVISSAKLWGLVAHPLKLIQIFAVLDVLHIIFGIVRSPLGLTLTQVCTRFFNLFVIYSLCPDSRYHEGFILTIFVWALVAIARHGIYLLNLITRGQNWFVSLQILLCLVLYPLGFVGEASCILKALPFLSTGVYSIQMPNDHNISLSLLTIVYIMFGLSCIHLFLRLSNAASQSRQPTLPAGYHDAALKSK